MMAEDKKKSCCCPGVLAIIIAVLTILTMLGVIGDEALWVKIVVFVLAILIAIGSFGGCCCSRFCKTEQKQGE